MSNRVRSFLFLSGLAHRALDPNAKASSGGAELQVALLASALAARGHKVCIAAADDGFPDCVTWQGVRIRSAGRFDTGGLLDAVAALPRFLRIAREERPDFAVVYGWTSWLAILCLLRPLTGFRVAFVCALDGEIDGRFQRENPVRGRIFSWGMRAADVRFSITDAQAGLFHEAGMACHVTRLLVQGSVGSAPMAKSVDLLWVARCHPVKRPGLFLDLAEMFPHAKCRMICSRQDPGLWDSIQARAKSLSNIEFLAGVPYTEIQRHFDVTKVFVNTSCDEGVPNTFLHSAAGGCAIASLVSDPDGMLGAFGAGACAGGDFPLLAAGIRRLLDDPGALAGASEGTARFLREWHDNEKNLDAFLQGLPP